MMVVSCRTNPDKPPKNRQPWELHPCKPRDPCKSLRLPPDPPRFRLPRPSLSWTRWTAARTTSSVRYPCQRWGPYTLTTAGCWALSDSSIHPTAYLSIHIQRTKWLSSFFRTPLKACYSKLCCWLVISGASGNLFFKVREKKLSSQDTFL